MYISMKFDEAEIHMTAGEVFISISDLAKLSDEQIVSGIRFLQRQYPLVANRLMSGYDLNPPTSQERQSRRRQVFNRRRDKLMIALILRDEYVCAHKGCSENTDLTIDHIIPISKDGSDDLENLQLMCRRHNSSKGNRTK